MQLDIHHLQVIRAIADAGSLSRAAVVLGITQPAVSSQLSRLEHLLGYQLFDRRDSVITPTPMGELLLRRVNAVLPLMKQLLEDVRHQVEEHTDTPTIRVGTINSALNHLFSDILAPHWPHHTVAVQQDEDCTGLITSLRDRRLDLVVFKEYPNYEQRVHDDLDVRVLSEESTVVLLPTGHPLSRLPHDEPVDLAQLSDMDWALGSRTSSRFHEYFTESCLSHGFSPRVRHIADSWNFLCTLISDGAAGIGLARCSCVTYPEGITARRLKGNPMVWRMLIGWHRAGPIADQGDALVESAVAAYQRSAREGTAA